MQVSLKQKSRQNYVLDAAHLGVMLFFEQARGQLVAFAGDLVTDCVMNLFASKQRLNRNKNSFVLLLSPAFVVSWL